MGDPATPGLLGAAGITFVAAVTDVRTRRIPNALVLVGLVTTPALVAIGGGWMDALIGAGLGMLVLALPRLVARNAVGLGDIKLMGVVGMGAGMAGTLMVIGLAVAFAMPMVLWTKRGNDDCRRLPFAPFLALGVVAWLAVRLAARVGQATSTGVV